MGFSAQRCPRKFSAIVHRLFRLLLPSPHGPPQGQSWKSSCVLRPPDPPPPMSPRKPPHFPMVEQPPTPGGHLQAPLAPPWPSSGSVLEEFLSFEAPGTPSTDLAPKTSPFPNGFTAPNAREAFASPTDPHKASLCPKRSRKKFARVSPRPEGKMENWAAFPHAPRATKGLSAAPHSPVLAPHASTTTATATAF